MEESSKTWQPRELSNLAEPQTSKCSLAWDCLCYKLLHIYAIFVSICQKSCHVWPSVEHGEKLSSTTTWQHFGCWWWQNTCTSLNNRPIESSFDKAGQTGGKPGFTIKIKISKDMSIMLLLISTRTPPLLSRVNYQQTKPNWAYFTGDIIHDRTRFRGSEYLFGFVIIPWIGSLSEDKSAIWFFFITLGPVPPSGRRT